jgi:cytochrome P450
MLASFIHNGIERENVVDESILQILAESDTTATTIRVIMLYLGCII